MFLLLNFQKKLTIIFFNDSYHIYNKKIIKQQPIQPEFQAQYLLGMPVWTSNAKGKLFIRYHVKLPDLKENPKLQQKILQIFKDLE